MSLVLHWPYSSHVLIFQMRSILSFDVLKMAKNDALYLNPALLLLVLQFSPLSETGWIVLISCAILLGQTPDLDSVARLSNRHKAYQATVTTTVFWSFPIDFYVYTSLGKWILISTGMWPNHRRCLSRNWSWYVNQRTSKNHWIPAFTFFLFR